MSLWNNDKINDSNKIRLLGVENTLPLIGDNYEELKCQKWETVI